MMRSLSSAVAGLRTHQTKMDVIGNNIANVNTYGFKASRTTFADVYYQNLSRGGGPTTTTGGTNPTQIGYGSAIATIDVLNTQSGAASTDRAMDVYITGEGFLVTQDAMGNFLYTRLGNLGFDAEGNLVDGSGKYVMGFPQRADGSAKIGADGTVEESALQAIKVSPDLLDQLTGISINSGGEIIGILPGDTRVVLGSGLPGWIDVPTIPKGSSLQGPVNMMIGALPDEGALQTALGGTVTNVKFGEYSLAPGQNLVVTSTPGGRVTVKMDVIDNEGVTSTITAEGELENGRVVLKYDGKEAFSFDFTGTMNDTTASPATVVSGALKYQLTTRDKGGNVRSTENATKNAVPQLLTGAKVVNGQYEIELGDAKFYFTVADATNYSGTIARIGMSEGDKINIGCIVLANFANNAALEQAGNTQYVKSQNSGNVIYSKPDTNGVGALKANYLEMSNVDVSKEFTDMITTQRGFQANTRIVTVSDEMLNELVNLKR